MTYRWVEHTAELQLEIEADEVEGVFAEAVAAFGELLHGGDQGRQLVHEVELSADDRPGLLVELLEELVFLADTARFVPAGLAEIDLGEKRASIRGSEGDPPPLVKGVTYHGLELRFDDGKWRARVVLDD